MLTHTQAQDMKRRIALWQSKMIDDPKEYQAKLAKENLVNWLKGQSQLSQLDQSQSHNLESIPLNLSVDQWETAIASSRYFQ